MSNNYKKGFTKQVYGSLKQTHYAFADIIKNISQLHGQANSDHDDCAAASLKHLKERAVCIEEKTGELSRLYQPYLNSRLEVICSCVDAELRRLSELKNLVITNNKYEHAAKLRELEKDIINLRKEIVDLYE